VDPEERFAALVQELADEPGVQPPQPGAKRLFGARTLKVNGSIFAMLSRGALVVKLPPDRVAQLIADGAGGPFEAGMGNVLRAWLTLPDDADWPGMAREALTYVSSRNS
jgi:hypothetical protein